MLKADDYQWNDGLALLHSLTRACRTINDTVKTRLPIHWKLLEVMLFEIQRIYHNQIYLCGLYKAMLAIGYYGPLRVGEITKSSYVIKMTNVHLGCNKNKLLIILYSSKLHDKESHPKKIKISGNYNKKDKFKKCVFLPIPFN